MENKWGKSLGMVAILALVLMACKPQSTAQDFQKAIEKADTLWACKVDGYPTKEADQRKDLRYVYGYEVKNVHPLLAAEVTAVKAALLDSLTFDTTAVKSCPMVAQYAIAVRQATCREAHIDGIAPREQARGSCGWPLVIACKSGICAIGTNLIFGA